MHRLAGAAIARLEAEASRQFVSDVFWFSIEFGVISQRRHGDDRWLAYGAGLLSSYGELRWRADDDVARITRTVCSPTRNP